MQTTRTEMAWWLWAIGILGFILLLIIVRQEPKIVRTLRSSPAARSQLQAVAQQLIEQSKTSGKKNWVRSDPDFPAQAKAMGIKVCVISPFGERLVLKVPITPRRDIVIHPKNAVTITRARPYDGATGSLGDGIFVQEHFDGSQIVTVDMTGGSETK